MADDAYTFIRALGFDKIDIFSFSLGGMIAQDLVVKHPDLVRKLVLTGTGPAGGKDIDKVAGTTYYDILRPTLTRSDPKEFLFFNRNATGKPAAKAFVKRLEERTVDRDAPIKVKAFQTQLKAIKKWGRSAPADLSKITQPTLIANGDNDRMVPSVLLRGPAPPHHGLRADHLPRLRPRRHLPVPRQVRPRRRRVPRPLTGIRSHRRNEHMTTTIPFTKKPFASSILLWMRTDQPRQQGMDYWKGPHSKIISPTPGFDEYRQIHLAETNPGLWPATPGVETAIPADRRIDGVAEVTFASVLSPLRGRKQTRLAYQDEINVFRRTLLYAGPPNSARWYDVAEPGEKTGARALIYIRRREGVGTRPFRKFVTDELVPALANTGVMTELRTQVFMPWNEKLWDTPNVAHDNPTDQRFHASLIFGFKDAAARAAFFAGEEITTLSDRLSGFASAVHAYDVFAALTYVKDGVILPHYQE